MIYYTNQLKSVVVEVKKCEFSGKQIPYISGNSFFGFLLVFIKSH